MYQLMFHRSFAVSQRQHRYQKKERNLVDVFLYTLAGSALAVMSFSFLLWLQF